MFHSMVQIQKLREHPHRIASAARWLSEKWGIPEPEYRASMEQCLEQQTGVPQWYIVLDGEEKIAAGAGVIENDFHERKDLHPNLCALYVEKPFRGRGIAGDLLAAACTDMASMGVERLYLVTDHVGFYEWYGWRFLTTVQDDSGLCERMYTTETAVRRRG